MRIAVDHGCALDTTVALQQAYRERDVIEETEAFAVIVERVVKTTADIAGDATTGRLDGGACSSQRAAGHQSQLLHHAHRPRQLEATNLHLRQRVRMNLVHKLGGVNEREVGPRHGLRLEEFETATGTQLAVDGFVLEHRKHVVSERDEVIVGRINEEHVFGL